MCGFIGATSLTLSTTSTEFVQFSFASSILYYSGAPTAGAKSVDEKRFERALRAIEKSRSLTGSLDPEAVLDSLVAGFPDEASSDYVAANLGLERLDFNELDALARLAGAYTPQAPDLWDRLIDAVRYERLRLQEERVQLVRAMEAGRIEPGGPTPRAPVPFVIRQGTLGPAEAAANSIRSAYQEIQAAMRENSIQRDTADALSKVLVLLARACHAGAPRVGARRVGRLLPPEDLCKLAITALRIDMRLQQRIFSLQRKVQDKIWPLWQRNPRLLLSQVIERIKEELDPDERERFDKICAELDKAVEDRAATLARELREETGPGIVGKGG